MNCTLCQQSVYSFLDAKTDITYYHCKVCEFIFKSPEYYQDFARQKERYNLHDNDTSHPGYQAYFQRFIDFIVPHVGKPTLALDFGCGESTLLADMLNTEGIPTDYYDPIYYPDTLTDEKQYALILSTEVFEHLHDPKAVFDSLINRLEKGGYLALQTAFHSNEIESFKRWYYHQDPTHIVFFRVKSFEVLAAQSGCKVLRDNGKNMILIQKPF